MKINYTEELIAKCRPIFKQGLRYIYKYTQKQNVIQKLLLREFQTNVEKIPGWNSLIVLKEFDRFKMNSNCHWLDKLINAAFLAEFDTSKQSSNIKIEIPKSQDFIHSCYVDIARNIWKKPQLLFDGFSNEIRREYELELDAIVRTSIINVIKNMLPMEKLVNNYIKTHEDEDELYNSDEDADSDDEQIEITSENNDDGCEDFDEGIIDEPQLGGVVNITDEPKLDDEVKIINESQLDDEVKIINEQVGGEEIKIINEQVGGEINGEVKIIDEQVGDVTKILDQIQDYSGIEQETNNLKHIKTVVLTNVEKKKQNTEKIKKVLGLDMDYNEFVQNKDHIKKKLLMRN